MTTSRAEVLHGDCRVVMRLLRPEMVQCVVTSPPHFGLRTYEGLPASDWNDGWHGCLGNEPEPKTYVAHMVEVFEDIRRVLRPDGVVWLNLGDSYARDVAKGLCKPCEAGFQANTCASGSRAQVAMDLKRSGLKAKDLLLVPHRVAIALQEAGWYVRADVVWAKPNCLPSSATDRPTRSHEYIFLLTKSAKYFYDANAMRKPHSEVSKARVKRRRAVGHKWEHGPGGQTIANVMTRALHPMGSNLRSVWTISPKGYKGAHFATMPEEIASTCVRLGTSERGRCSWCGKPLKRIIEKGSPNREWKQACGADSAGEYHGHSTKNHEAAGVQDASAVKARILEGLRPRITVGWEPTCRCNAEVVPCLVFDPFAGAGTTGVAALRNNCRFIGVEGSAIYVEMAMERLKAVEEQMQLW